MRHHGLALSLLVPVVVACGDLTTATAPELPPTAVDIEGEAGTLALTTATRWSFHGTFLRPTAMVILPPEAGSQVNPPTVTAAVSADGVTYHETTATLVWYYSRGSYLVVLSGQVGWKYVVLVHEVESVTSP
jgi:hypothetical protein